MQEIKIKGTKLSYQKLSISYLIYYNDTPVAMISFDKLSLIIKDTKDYELLQSLSLILYMYQQKTLYGQENYKV